MDTSEGMDTGTTERIVWQAAYGNLTARINLWRIARDRNEDWPDQWGWPVGATLPGGFIATARGYLRPDGTHCDVR